MKPALIRPIKGTRDFYPPDIYRRRGLLEPVQHTLERFGYEPYDAPLLEPLALYTAKSSAEIIERQSYVFEDRGGERVVIRPEMTPSLARLIAGKQRELPTILRWYSFPECWRYERPQKGRLRNFLQINVDLLGSDTVQADTEIADIALSLLRALGVTMETIELRINDRRLLEGWLIDCKFSPAAWPGILSLLDGRDKMEPVAFATALTTYGSDSQTQQLLSLLSLSSAAIAKLPQGERVSAVAKNLKDLGWEKNVRIDPTIIRGFTYYTGIVFEVYETSGDFRRAIFGGGRYDQLVEAVGGTPISGIGFGVSDVSLEETLKVQGKDIAITSVERTIVIPFSPTEELFANQCLNLLRAAGNIAERALPPYDLKKQLTFAAKRQATWAVIIFPDEAAQGRVALKNLMTGTQEIIALSELAQKISAAKI